MAGIVPRECLWKSEAEIKGWGAAREPAEDLRYLQEIGKNREGDCST